MTITVRLTDEEKKMLEFIKKKYQEVNKSIRISTSDIIRICLIHEYENNVQ